MTNRIDFRTLATPKTPNWYLAAPESVCELAKPQMTAPKFTKLPEGLWHDIVAAVAAEPRVSVHDQDKVAGYLDFTQVSFLLRFPDRVTIKVFPIGTTGATLAIYSRSKYGRSDLGVNEKRVKRLLAALTPIKG